MKIIRILMVMLTLLCVLSACGEKTEMNDYKNGIEVTDAFGNICTLPGDARVVSAYASFAECWQLAGGTLVGVTEDAVSEHHLVFDDRVEMIGTVKHVDLEKIVALNPDYVILSADLTVHLSLKESLQALGIPFGYFCVDIFEDYKDMMAQFCAVTGRMDLYQVHVTDVEARIVKIKDRIPKTDASVLLMRAFSSGIKAKTDDNLAGQILKEYGLRNIADEHESLLEDLSVEHIVKSDPDFIFALTMGDYEGACAFLEESVVNHPAWAGLKAVKQGQYHILPKELFHYKPNQRWDESYEYIAKLIWPEIFSGEE